MESPRNQVAFPVKEKFSGRDRTDIDTSIHRELGFLMGAFLIFGSIIKFNTVLSYLG